jgi:hypothetical protein
VWRRASGDGAHCPCAARQAVERPATANIDTRGEEGGTQLLMESVKSPNFQFSMSAKSSQVNIHPKAKSKTRSKQNKNMHKYSSVYCKRGVPLPVLTSGGE